MQLQISLRKPIGQSNKAFALPPSKSLLARRLILNVLEGKALPVYNREERKTLPEDIQYLHKALKSFLDRETEICVGESGTAMRLLTPLLAFKVKQTTKLYGLGRQHERPISSLVEALRLMGADIEYLEKDGFPPLLIRPSIFKPTQVELDASQSSQYLSALLLLAPLVKNESFSIDTRPYKLVSSPYAFMTMNVLQESGYHWQESQGLFSFQGKELTKEDEKLIEADWTAASYAYELCSLLETGKELLLPKLILYSMQGDSRYLPSFFEQFGVKTKIFNHNAVLLVKEEAPQLRDIITLDCTECPDLVPTFVATCIMHRVAFSFQGVEHLKIKESNRLEILRRECAKVGVKLQINGAILSWNGTFSPITISEITLNPEGDHRMAMALTPMMYQLSKKSVIIKNPEVVAKSFPNYWDNLSIFGYSVNKLD